MSEADSGKTDRDCTAASLPQEEPRVHTDSPNKYSTTIKILLCLIIIFSVVNIVLIMVGNFNASSVWDDSYMFVRYAKNILRYGKICWNQGMEPTYGLTSLLYLTVSAPVNFWVPLYPALAASLSSLTSGVLFLILALILLARGADMKRPFKGVFIALFFYSLSNAGADITDHFLGGMDTCFSMAFLTAYILIHKWRERSLSLTAAILTGAVGGLAFSVRPDLLLFSFCVPLSIFFFSKDRKEKRNAVAILIVSALVVAIQIYAAYLYFHSPAPLPFYVKSLKYYGPAIYKQYRSVALRQFFGYVSVNWLLFLPTIFCFAMYPREWVKKMSALDKGLTIATSLFLFYYLFFVLQIMFHSKRFYYPTLPALIYLAAKSGTFLADKIGEFIKSRRIQFPKPIAIFAMLSMLGTTSSSIYFSVDYYFFYLSTDGIGAYDRYNLDEMHKMWYGLDKFSSLPDDLVIATTEVGMASALNPFKTIVDLAGLNETHIAHNGFSAEYLFQKYHPDLIYMPHPHYEEMIAQIKNDRYFIQNYDYFPAENFDSILGIAIYKNSKYYLPMRGIVQNRK